MIELKGFRVKEGGYKGFINSKSLNIERKFKIDTLSETIKRLKSNLKNIRR